ncbi:MAG: hypothetical protein MHM6MM_001842 [Cercozoa sp. M6MM]
MSKNESKKFIKPGRVVVLLAGRFAGKKAVIVKVNNGSKARPFPHVIVAGVERAPLKVTKSMSKKQILRKSQIKSFVKFVNLQHVMPTRFTIPNADLQLKDLVTAAAIKDADKKAEVKKTLRKTMKTRYLEKEQTAPTAFLFSKLKF